MPKKVKLCMYSIYCMVYNKIMLKCNTYRYKCSDMISDYMSIQHVLHGVNSYILNKIFNPLCATKEELINVSILKFHFSSPFLTLLLLDLFCSLLLTP